MTLSEIHARELMQETSKCDLAQRKTTTLLEKLDKVHAHLAAVQGFLSSPPAARAVPLEQIRTIFDAYHVQDGEACTVEIEKVLRHYKEKMQRRIQKNQQVLASAQAAMGRPLASSKRKLQTSPEERMQELRSKTVVIQALQERLLRMAESPPAEAMVAVTESPSRAEELAKKKRRMEGPPPAPLAPTQGHEQMLNRLSMFDEEAQQAVESQEHRRVLASYRANLQLLSEAKALMSNSPPSPALEEKIVALERWQARLSSMLSRLLPSAEPTPAPPPPPLRRAPIETLASVQAREAEEAKSAAKEEAVAREAAVYERVVVPAQRQLLQEQSREAGAIRRWAAVSSAVGTAGVFVARDASAFFSAVTGEAAAIERVSAGVGALMHLHPVTQTLAAAALATTVVPRWTLTQTITGLAAGVGAGLIVGPMGGFAVGTVAGEYGSQIMRRATERVAGIANPVLRKWAKAKILERLRQQYRAEETAAQSQKQPEQSGEKRDRPT